MNEDAISENCEIRNTSISEARSLEELADYWDSHSLDDHWDQTHEVGFEVRARRRIDESLPLDDSSGGFKH